jgi:hypothetical protein
VKYGYLRVPKKKELRIRAVFGSLSEMLAVEMAAVSTPTIVENYSRMNDLRMDDGKISSRYLS